MRKIRKMVKKDGGHPKKSFLKNEEHVF